MLWLGQPENQMADETIEDFTRTFLRRLDAKLDRVVERLDDLTVVVREQGQRITSLQVDIAHGPQRIDAVERPAGQSRPASGSDRESTRPD
jgi:hypothetical protein